MDTSQATETEEPQYKIASFAMYSELVHKFAIFPRPKEGIALYPVLGLCGEAGEVAEKFKKILRDNNSIISVAKKKELAQELGDVLWYLNELALLLDTTLEDVATQNFLKLDSRNKRGKLGGSGDNR